MLIVYVDRHVRGWKSAIHLIPIALKLSLLFNARLKQLEYLFNLLSKYQCLTSKVFCRKTDISFQMWAAQGKKTLTNGYWMLKGISSDASLKFNYSLKQMSSICFTVSLFSFFPHLKTQYRWHSFYSVLQELCLFNANLFSLFLLIRFPDVNASLFEPSTYLHFLLCLRHSLHFKVKIEIERDKLRHHFITFSRLKYALVGIWIPSMFSILNWSLFNSKYNVCCKSWYCVFVQYSYNLTTYVSFLVIWIVKLIFK